MGLEYEYWRCNACGAYRKSSKIKKWTMDYCRCMKSGVDAEHFYTRVLGNAEIITKEEYEKGIRNPTR